MFSLHAADARPGFDEVDPNEDAMFSLSLNEDAGTIGTSNEYLIVATIWIIVGWEKPNQQFI